MADSVSNAQRHLRARYLDRKARGVCVNCDKEKNTDRVLCDLCTEKSRGYRRITKTKRVRANLCIVCCAPNDTKNEQCSNCYATSSADAKIRRGKTRLAALNKYGHRCNCCGETNEVFLAFDHVNDDGYIHRKEIPIHKFLTWLIDNEITDTIQILCHNCNWAKHVTKGNCPHKATHNISTAPAILEQPARNKDTE